ncbi:hypothetical protein JCGZ_23227 [Jatropha curcas]|uniref:pectinesterase n=1 Tax=Jatropha curcas TaxID=180498 RepID=A0A067JV21_JATCU|nr:probable pectinesterase 29 [Jatropha curcas]KDP23394.1 hypothetical protein JCGZ_23227 [Jatropha curcas]
MSLLHFNLYFVMVFFFLFLGISKANYTRTSHYEQEEATIAKTIIVDQKGRGHFTGIQKAIDSVPSKNNQWTLIHVKPGIYIEKVEVPVDKQFIILQGESRKTTRIQYGDCGSSTRSSTFILNADNFVAVNISFKNTYNLVIPRAAGRSILWAPAATIYSDKASFYGCGFYGVQDTLTDFKGRHYFKFCYIEGAIDFIWGRGQSVYQRCVINAKTGILNGTAGYITAQGRRSPNDEDGFSFLSCYIYGTGPVYLGRAYGQYSTVVFRTSYLSDVVKPEGWEAWFFIGRENGIKYSEVSCFGPGANKSRRVKWEKTLSTRDLKKLTNINHFINGDRWIQQQPQVDGFKNNLKSDDYFP